MERTPPTDTHITTLQTFTPAGGGNTEATSAGGGGNPTANSFPSIMLVFHSNRLSPAQILHENRLQECENLAWLKLSEQQNLCPSPHTPLKVQHRPTTDGQKRPRWRDLLSYLTHANVTQLKQVTFLIFTCRTCFQQHGHVEGKRTTAASSLASVSHEEAQPKDRLPCLHDPTWVPNLSRPQGCTGVGVEPGDSKRHLFRFVKWRAYLKKQQEEEIKTLQRRRGHAWTTSGKTTPVTPVLYLSRANQPAEHPDQRAYYTKP